VVTRWYSDTSNPLLPCSRRTWRSWLRANGVRAYRAGPRLLAERDAVDAAIRGDLSTHPQGGSDDAQAALARAGLRVIGGGR